MIEAGRVAEADRVGGREQTERRVWPNDAALIEQGQAARNLQHPLDDEHHVGTARVILVEAQRDIVLDRPGQHSVAKLRDLLAVLEHDRVLADEIDAGDVAVEVDAHARPVEARGDLLDMCRLARAVITRDHHPAVEGEARQDRERRVPVEQIVRIEIGNVFVAPRIARDLHIGIDAESLSHRYAGVGQTGRRFGSHHGLY